MTYRDLYVKTRNMLKEASESAGSEALLLLSYALGQPKERVILRFNEVVEETLLKKVLDLVQMRLSGVPLQYIMRKF